MKLFAGSQSKTLAESISKQLNIPLSAYELVTFKDSELKPVVKEDVRGEDVVIIASTSNPVNDAYMEFFLLVDALKRSAAKRITAVMPYFGYARQNQQHMPGEPVSARVMVKFIQTVGVDEFITIDLHEEQLTGFFDIPVNHLSALPLLAKKIADEIQNTKYEIPILVLSPDQGGVERTRKFRDALDAASQGKFAVDHEIGIVEKLRNLEGQHETKFVELSGDVNGKIVIIPDDVIVSGGTIAHAAEAGKEKGAAMVYLAATHADFVEGSTEILRNAPIEKVVITDTVSLHDEVKFEKLHLISVAELLAREIQKINS
ncbi:ribose-phosphate diphosphokinase [Candidatus Roizmanbacteria bacterium]|nr:ribose-phosphate diphosphokinase [Candidatus Roizmanbacteria bacterium]